MSWFSYSSLIPPSLFILLTSIGLALAWRWTRLGLVIATVGGALLYLASMPVVADNLIGYVRDLAPEMPILPSNAPPEAIIVLSADARKSDNPGRPYTVGPATLERLADAARTARRLGLPVLVSGGPPGGEVSESLAGMMSEVLQDDFQVPVHWREDRSSNTYENAAFSAEILRRAGVSSALLIMHCRDMARALWSFYAVGYPVIPANCGRSKRIVSQRQSEDEASSLSAGSFFPRVGALLVSRPRAPRANRLSVVSISLPPRGSRPKRRPRGRHIRIATKLRLRLSPSGAAFTSAAKRSMFRRVRSSDRMPNPVRSRTRSMPASTLRGLVEPLFNDFLRQSFEMLVPPGYTPIGTMKNFISMRRGWAAARHCRRSHRKWHSAGRRPASLRAHSSVLAT